MTESDHWQICDFAEEDYHIFAQYKKSNNIEKNDVLFEGEISYTLADGKVVQETISETLSPVNYVTTSDVRGIDRWEINEDSEKLVNNFTIKITWTDIDGTHEENLSYKK